MKKMQILFSLLYVCFSGCQKTATTSPWLYTAYSPQQKWNPSYKEIERVLHLFLKEDATVPCGNQVVALGELFDLGLRNSPIVGKIWQQAREAAAAYSVSQADYYPTLSFDMNLTSSRQGYVFAGDFLQSTQTYYGPYFFLNYTIWDSGTRAAKSEANLQALYHANWTHNESIQSTLQSIASAFYDHLYAKALLEALEKDLLDAEQNYAAAIDNMKLGIKDVTDMLQAKSKFLQKSLQVQEQKTIVSNSYIHLLKESGIPTGVQFEVPAFPECPPIETLDLCLDQLIEVARLTRPDLLAAKADILSKESIVKMQQAEALPVLKTNMDIGETHYSGGFSNHGTYNVVVDFSVPIFSGLLYRNRVRQAKAVADESRQALRQIELEVSSQVESAYNDFALAKQQVILTQSYLDAAEQEYQAVYARYRRGTNDILDVFSSEASLSDARARFIRAKKSLFVSMVKLAFATGTLTHCLQEVT